LAETTVKILLHCGFRRTGKEMGQVCQCWWRICREIKAFFQVRISHVLRFISICDLFTDSLSYMYRSHYLFSESIRFESWPRICMRVFVDYLNYSTKTYGEYLQVDEDQYLPCSSNSYFTVPLNSNSQINNIVFGAVSLHSFIRQ
jgi:hypothetical protein